MELEKVKELTEKIIDIIDHSAKYMKNVSAVNKIKKHIFEIRMATLNGYILEKVSKIEINIEILYSARKHLKYPHIEHFIREDCTRIQMYIENASQMR